MRLQLRRIVRLFARAVRLRCPNCGGGPIFSSWLRMCERCPRCGLSLERGEEGYQVGSYMFNIIAAELVFAAMFLAVMAATWPTPPWDLLLYGGIVLTLIAPFLFFPFSKTIFLAFDLVFRPAEPAERPAARRRNGVQHPAARPSPCLSGTGIAGASPIRSRQRVP